MTDFSKILNKAKELEAKMKESQEKIKSIQVKGTSGADSVIVTLNGDGEMIKLEISPETVSADNVPSEVTLPCAAVDSVPAIVPPETLRPALKTGI